MGIKADFEIKKINSLEQLFVIEKDFFYSFEHVFSYKKFRFGRLESFNFTILYENSNRLLFQPA